MKVANNIGKSKAGFPIYDYEAGFLVKKVEQKSDGTKNYFVKDKKSLKTYFFEGVTDVLETFGLIRNNEATKNQLPEHDLDLYED